MLAMANHAAPVYHVRHLNLPSLVLCWLSTAGQQDCNRGDGPLIQEILRAPAGNVRDCKPQRWELYLQLQVPWLRLTRLCEL